MPDKKDAAPTRDDETPIRDEVEIEGAPPHGDTNERADERADIREPDGSPSPRA